MKNIILCGGFSDITGIFWEKKGNFWIKPGENIKKLGDKYGYWWPEINSKTMVNAEYDNNYYGITTSAYLFKHPGSKEEYLRLLKISTIKYVYQLPRIDDDRRKVNGTWMVTRELLN